MSVFFGLGDAELDLAIATQDLAEGVFDLFGREGDDDREAFLVLGHGDEDDVQFFRPGEVSKVGRGEGLGDFSGPVFAEVEENNGITISDKSDRLTALGDGDRLDVFVSQFFVVRIFDIRMDIGCLIGAAFGHNLVGLLNTVPIVVAIHRIISAADTREATDSFGMHPFFKLLDHTVATGWGRISTVGKGMDEDFFGVDALVFGEFEEGIEVVAVRMDRALTEESHDMETATGFFDGVGGLEEAGVGEEIAALHGQGDAGEVLVDDLAGAEGHVTDFAIALGVPRETDGDARGLESGQGVVSVEVFEEGCFGFEDGVTLQGVADAPAIEDNEDDWLWNGHRNVG